MPEVVAPVVLWDIDGTLLRAPGLGARAFVAAVEEVTGRTWIPKPLDFGGRTDPDIALRILADAGAGDAELVPAVLAAVEVIYEGLAEELRSIVRVMPGVVEALAALDDRGATQTVLTGNVRAIALAKLAAAGLTDHLRAELGAYGSDHGDRAELARLAVARSRRAESAGAASAVAWVVGDTPRDLDCARANGLRCALVATGTFPLDALVDLGADLVLADLADPQPLLEAIAPPP